MEEYRDIDKWLPHDAGCAIALGRFDGVHLGHRTLIERTVEHAREHNLTPVCFSFQEGTYPGAGERGQLTTDEEKADILSGIGIEVLLHPEFDRPLIDMSAIEFLNSLLIERWGAKLIVVGFDFHFGKDRLGDTELLRRESESRGIEVAIIRAFKVDSEIVKATKIRELIRNGEIEKANCLLGRPYSVKAKRNPGRQFGRIIGFPTINFIWPVMKVKPKHGVYAVRIESDASKGNHKGNRKRDQIENHRRNHERDRTTSPPLAGGIEGGLNGVANFGVRPTFEPDNPEALLEVHVLDDVRDIISGPDSLPTDTTFKIEFHAFIRPEKKFRSVEELKEQIARDCDKAGMLLNNEAS